MTVPTFANLLADARSIGAVARISAIPQIGGAVATRLLTLIRPDRAIFVNSSSDERLAALTDLLRTRLTARNTKGEVPRYRDLLGWFRERSWHRAHKPAGPCEVLLWSVRGALSDGLAYSDDALRVPTAFQGSPLPWSALQEGFTCGSERVRFASGLTREHKIPWRTGGGPGWRRWVGWSCQWRVKFGPSAFSVHQF